MIAAIENGFPQQEIADAAYLYQQQIDQGEKIIVGVNKYKMDDQVRIETLKITQEMEDTQVNSLRQVKHDRDQAHVDRSLELLQQAARTSQNLIPLILDAVRGYATVGEVCTSLIPVFGVYRETSVI